VTKNKFVKAKNLIKSQTMTMTAFQTGLIRNQARMTTKTKKMLNVMIKPKKQVKKLLKTSKKMKTKKK
jgi:hypothetical protein